MKRLSAALLALVLAASTAGAQSLPTGVTYIASVSGQATTAAVILSLESSATVGIRITKICVGGVSPATAAAAATVTVQRRGVAASSGGTALTNEGTGVTAIAKMNPASANFGGIGRLGGTPGTAGAVLDQWGFVAGELGAGAADVGSNNPHCVLYGEPRNEPIIISAGVINGLSINLSSLGAGGLSAASIAVTFIAE